MRLEASAGFRRYVDHVFLHVVSLWQTLNIQWDARDRDEHFGPFGKLTVQGFGIVPIEFPSLGVQGFRGLGFRGFGV